MDVSLHYSTAAEAAHRTLSTVVVPLDGSAAAEASLLVAGWLCSRLGASLQRVTVETGPNDPVALVEDDGEVEYILHGSDVGTALIEHLDHQPGSLVCMASRARGGLHRRLSGNLVDHLVVSGAAPMVVIGPGCEGEALATPPATILLAASDHLPAAAVALCGGWAMAMDADVVVATVMPPVSAGVPHAARVRERAGWPSPSDGFLGGVARFPAEENDALLGPLVRRLARHGIASEAYHLVGGTAATSLLAFAESLPQPVLLVAPTGEPDGRIPGDVTHQLLQRGRWPVVASLGRVPVG